MEDQTAYSKVFVTIGKNLHTIRHAAKKTLEGVAADLSITHSSLSKIENGRYPGLGLGLLLKICDYYSVSLEQVLDIKGSQIFNYSQNINQPTGNHTLTNQLSEGYQVAITGYKAENEYLKSHNQQLADQNQQLLNSLLEIKTK